MSDLDTSIKSYALLCKRTPYANIKNILNNIDNTNNINSELYHVKSLYNQVGGDVMDQIANHLCQDGGGSFSANLGKFTKSVGKIAEGVNKGVEKARTAHDKVVRTAKQARETFDQARQITADTHNSVKKALKDLHGTINDIRSEVAPSVAISVEDVNTSLDAEKLKLELRSAKEKIKELEDQIIEFKRVHGEQIQKLKADIEREKNEECDRKILELKSQIATLDV